VQPPQPQLTQYLPVLMLGILAVLFSAGMLVGSVILGKKGKRTPIKDTPYECGMLPVGPGNARMSIKFYLVAMLFILFDIEVIFLFPIAVQLRAFGTFALVETIVFVVLLMIAFVYVWRRGALEWK
jgi:NADH-quinone oxidoreductase subunit A